MHDDVRAGGPLAGLKVIEVAGLGPGPFCSMLLADMGADVLRIDRPGDIGRPVPDAVLRRSRRSAAIDLKHPEAAGLVLRLVGDADVLIEGFRPGVAERLGIGPDECLAANPRLVYGRVTGWGRSGPLASAPGHDINYIALAGLLGSIGRPGALPTVPLNVIGDFGGGGMLLLVGILAALAGRTPGGGGQVVDAAMVDGAALLGALLYGLADEGRWSVDRGTNLLDGGAYYYDAYETADGEHVAFGALEPQFHAAMVEALELDPGAFRRQMDPSSWAERKQQVAAAVRRRTRAEWCERLEGTDACCAPVLSLTEAPKHPHNVERDVFVQVDGLTMPAPAPHFSATPCPPPRPWARPGADTTQLLQQWGVASEELDRLGSLGVVVQADTGESD
jgi:alpha-methylacyl-CoA racemase